MSTEQIVVPKVAGPKFEEFTFQATR